MLTRILARNRALHDSASMPTSRMKEEIARILKDGYVADCRVVETKDEKDEPLPYRTSSSSSSSRVRVGDHRSQAGLKARPARRRQDRLPRVLGGLGTAIMLHLDQGDHPPPGRRARRRRRSDRLRPVGGAPERCRRSAGNRSNCLQGDGRALARSRTGRTTSAATATRLCRAHADPEKGTRRSSSPPTNAARTRLCTA